MWSQLRDVLTDFEFLQARLGCPGGVAEPLAATEIFDVLEDYVAALESLPEEQASSDVQELYRTLDGDSHALKLDTSIVLQQVHNCLLEKFDAATGLGQRLRAMAKLQCRWWLDGAAPRHPWLRILTTHKGLVDTTGHLQ